jgi:hypothetical protein
MLINPNLKNLDDVEVDIKTLRKKKRRRLKGQDRKEWTAILWETKAKLKRP